MRQLSSDLLADLFDGDTGEAILALVTIEHADLSEPIRVTSDGVKTWSADQDSTTAEDLTSNNNDGTLVNGPTWTSDGPNDAIRGALSFDGVDDYVDAGELGPLSITDSYTLEVWFKAPTSKSETGQLIGFDDVTDGRTWQFRLDAQNNVQFIRFNSNHDVVSNFETSETFNDDRWHHAAAVFDNSVGSKIYVDGEELASDPDTTNNDDGDGVSLGLGSRDSGSAALLLGGISEARIWNTARTQQQIQDNMNKRLNGDESGLVGYWPLNDTTDEFLPFPFQLTLPDQSDEGEMNAKLTIDNVDRRVTKAVRTLSSAPKVTMQIVRGSAPDVTEAQFPDFNLTNVSYDQHMVEGTLTLESLISQPMPGDSFRPDNFPGLF